MIRSRRIFLFLLASSFLVSMGSAFPVTITLIQKLTGPVVNVSFGAAVMPAGDVNGDGFPDVLIQQQVGLGNYLYYGSPTGLVASGWFVEGFRSVASAGDVDGDGFDDIILGNSEIGAGGHGQAKLFLGSASGPSTTADWTRDGQNEEAFGRTVRSAGDTNDDGYDDVMIAAPRVNSGEVVNTGAIYIFNGKRQGLSSTPTVTIPGEDEQSLLGGDLARLGDVDGDGFEDILIGNPLFGLAGQNPGKIYLHMGSAANLEEVASWTFTGGIVNILYGNLLGETVESAGDVNGDGYRDLLIGDRSFPTETATAAGQATVTLGTATGLESTFQWSSILDEDFSFWGSTVAGDGDVNGDGFDDILVGSWAYPQSGAQILAGYARLYLGQAAGSGVNAGHSWERYGEHAAAVFSEAMAMVGDLNGDGRSEFAIGAPGFIDGSSGEVGAVYIYSGCDEGDADGICDFMDNCLGLANTAQVDGDTDGFGDACDCAVGDPSLWSAPGPVSSLTVSPDAGAGSTLDWLAPTESGSSGGAMTYDTLRSSSSSFDGATCLESGGTDRVSLDATDPAPGQVLFYLVRPLNSCGWATASLGVGTGNVARSAPDCP